MMRIILTAAFLILPNSFLFASYDEALKLYEAKKYAESLKVIAGELDVKKDMEKDAPNYNLRFLAAHNHWKTGNITSAVSHLKRCAEIKNDIPDPLIDLALLMLDNKRYGDANFYAQSAIKKAYNPASYYILGKSAMKTGNYYKAKEYLEKAVSLDPESWFYYNDLGMVLMNMKKFSEANTAFSAAASMSDSVEVINNLGLSLELAGRLDEAMSYFNKADEMMPGNTVIKENINRLKGKINAAPKK